MSYATALHDDLCFVVNQSSCGSPRLSARSFARGVFVSAIDSHRKLMCYTCCYKNEPKSVKSKYAHLSFTTASGSGAAEECTVALRTSVETTVRHGRRLTFLRTVRAPPPFRGAALLPSSRVVQPFRPSVEATQQSGTTKPAGQREHNARRSACQSPVEEQH